MPKSYSIDYVCAALGITDYEARKLDELDGKADEKIKKDIFTEAKEYLDNAQPVTEEEIDEKGWNVFNFSKFTDVGKAVAATIARENGIACLCIQQRS